MAIYFTNNQYLKTAEEDFEAAEIIFGHKYYDQTASLCSIALVKYLKAVIESIYIGAECTPYFNTEDKVTILRKIKERLPKFDISEEECQWVDNVYGKANCTDGIHIIMPKQTAVDAMKIVEKARKAAKAIEKTASDDKK